MKKTTFLFGGILVILIVAALGCNIVGPCKNITERQAIFLVDVSDSVLFTTIQNDISLNLGGFMKRTELCKINECEKFTLSMAHLSAKEDLQLTSASISISKMGESRNKVKQQSAITPLAALVKIEMEDYKNLSLQKGNTNGSNICNNVIKAINNGIEGADKTVLVFSDMVENNSVLNMYQRKLIPADAALLVEKLIEPSVLSKFRNEQTTSALKLIIVLKHDSKTDYRKVKAFWEAFFKSLKIEDLQFIDNLTNSVTL